jgi:DNA polymerase-1
MLIDTPEKFHEALSAFSRALTPSEPIVTDLETDGLATWRAANPSRMVGISMTGLYGQSDSYYFTFRHAEGRNLPEELLQPLRDLLRDREQVFHNAQFDLAMLYKEGFQLPAKIQDTIVAASLVNENEGDEQGFGLKPLSVKYLGADADEEERVLGAELKARKLRGKGNMYKLPAALVEPYACQDVKLTRDLYWNRHKELNRWRLLPLFQEVNRYLLALTRMHLRGFMIDREEIARQRATIGPRIETARARLRELAGFDINVNSSAQLQKWLGVTTTKKEYLYEVLASTPREDIQALLTYRGLTKLESMYFEPWCELADINDRLHASFSLTKVTGRISAYSPNLQQVTKDRNTGVSVRRCLKPREGTFLVECDYSTVEPRIAAHFSQDPAMLEAFRKGEDFHTSTAKRVYRDSSILKDDKRRDRAKTIGLGILYGMGSFKAAKSCGLRHEPLPDGTWEYHHELAWTMVDGEIKKVACSEISREFCTCAGKEWVQKYYAALPELEPFARRLKEKAETYKYIRNPISGRVRRFVGKRSSPHKALNSLIQGTAADIMRKALVAVDEWIGWGNDEDKPRLLLTVHDSILAEIPFGPNAEAHVREIKRLMEDTTTLSVPLTVDVKFGTSWGNMVGLQ